MTLKLKRIIGSHEVEVGKEVTKIKGSGKAMSPTTITPEYDIDPAAETSIFKPFFLSGIATVLTAGCLLGALALLGISIQGNYASPDWAPYILAHANAQFYGWVGLFVMGFALQRHSPRQSKLKMFYTLAYTSLGLILLGTTIRFIAEPLSTSHQTLGLCLGIFASLCQMFAVLLFLVNTETTRHRGIGPLTWPSLFVFAALFWWTLVSGLEPFFFYWSHSGSPISNVFFIAEWFPAYRDAQFLGFVLTMIFGVAFVKLPEWFGFRSPHSLLAIYAFTLWSGGVIVRMAGWVLYFRHGFNPHSFGLYFAGGLLLAIGAICIVIASRVFEPVSYAMRSQKFIRGAFFWLVVSGMLLVLEPFHLSITSQQFSHPFLGAIRHAITVGVISQMIIGVSMHLVALKSHLDPKKLPSLWIVFWLINLGNFGRVACEISSDYTKFAFSIMPITGFLEVAGVIIWAVMVFAPVIWNRQPRRRLSSNPDLG